MTLGGSWRALVPGWGQIQRGRPGKGLLLFFFFAFFLNAYFVLPYVHEETEFRYVSLGLAVFFWLVSFIDALRQTPPRDESGPAAEAPASSEEAPAPASAAQEPHD